MESCKAFQVPSLEPVVLTDLHLLAVLARAFRIIYPTSWTTKPQGKQKEQNTYSTYFMYWILKCHGPAMGHNTKKTYGIHSIHVKTSTLSLVYPFTATWFPASIPPGIFGSEVGPFPIGLRTRVLQGSRSCSPMSFLETSHKCNGGVMVVFTKCTKVLKTLIQTN